ncbi:MAG TPA: SRPBCC family protein [Lacipirellulaceae bacterium]|nr:SRPBCC family protein [Lacipirellulaceae bacterium]
MYQSQHASPTHTGPLGFESGNEHYFGEAPLRQFRLQHAGTQAGMHGGSAKNVGRGERMVSIAAGGILAMLGLGRRDLTGLAIAGVGGALAYRGSTGHCSMYQAMGVSTADESSRSGRGQADQGVRVSASYLINKPPQPLYAFWRNFENLPQFMSHLESVRKIDDQRSHWVAKAPKLYGGSVEWDAEVTADEPNARIAWRSLPGSDVEHTGSIKFMQALGDRGTKVRVDLEYHPPAGQVGRWLATLFGEEPKQQIHDDLRRFKRLMELGEIPTIVGQPRGTCRGHGARQT